MHHSQVNLHLINWKTIGVSQLQNTFNSVKQRRMCLFVEYNSVRNSCSHSICNRKEELESKYSSVTNTNCDDGLIDCDEVWQGFLTRALKR